MKNLTIIIFILSILFTQSSFAEITGKINERVDDTLIVEFFENGKRVGEIEYPDKSMYYVKDAAENWVTGIMTKDTIRKYSIAA